MLCSLLTTRVSVQGENQEAKVGRKVSLVGEVINEILRSNFKKMEILFLRSLKSIKATTL